MTSRHKSTVSLPNDFDVVVIRDFDARREVVFDAWTTPEIVSRWLLGPPGWTMPVCEIDLRVGGKFRWRWRSEAGAEFGFVGEFREVVRPSRIVHTELYDPGDVGGDMGEECLVTTVFAHVSGATRQTMTIHYQSKADRDAALRTGMTGGMEQSFEKLDTLLASTD
jgi:uncharacterized protein YndB with AHSA1/START domain